MGRSGNGLTTKIHALDDAQGPPIKLHLTAGQKSDIEAAPGLIADIPAGPCSLPTRAMMRTACARTIRKRAAGEQPSACIWEMRA